MVKRTRVFVWLLLAVFASGIASAQVTYNTITATIVDPSGHPYANAQYAFMLVNSQGIPINNATTPNGQIFNAQQVLGRLDANGALSVQLVPNATLTGPRGSAVTFWKLTISAPPESFIINFSGSWAINYQFSVTGDADISTPVNALAQPISFANLRTNQSTFSNGSGTVQPSVAAFPLCFYPTAGSTCAPATALKFNPNAAHGAVPGALYSINNVTLLPQIDVRHQIFASGLPIFNFTLGGPLSCTGTPTATVSAPANATVGVQATVTLACVNSTVVITDYFGGAGYDNTATASISGGGTSGGITLTPGFGAYVTGVDPLGLVDSTAGLQEAFNYSSAIFPPTSAGPYPCVYIAPGTYLVSSALRIPSIIHVCGGGYNTTILQATNANANIATVYQNSWVTPGNVSGFTTGGSISGLTFTTQLKGVNGQPFNGYKATFLEINAAHYNLAHLQFINGGGRGLVVNSAGEEINAEDVWCNAVRWCDDGEGQAKGNFTNIFENSGGAALNSTGYYYCFAATCSNGYWFSQNWAPSTVTVASATTDGAGNATFVINCTPTPGCYNQGVIGSNSSSPIVAGQFFHISGITDPTYAAMNGDFRATAVTGAPGSPFTITTTYNASTAPDAGLQSGGTFDYGPDQNLLLRGGTLQTPAAGSPASLTGATFQIDTAPNQNAAFTVGGPGNKLDSFRCSSAWWTNCVHSLGQQSSVWNGYVEFFSTGGIPGLSSAIRSPGYLPYTTSTAVLNTTTCSSNTPCGVPVVSTMWFTPSVTDATHTKDLAGAILGTSIMPQDFCASCVGQPSAYVAGVNRNQFEFIDFVTSPNGTAWVINRNKSGSTAPSNTVWPAGSLYGYNSISTFLGGDNSTSVKAIHTSGIVAGNKNFNILATDQTALISADYIIGPMFDGTRLIPRPQTGGFSGSVNVIMEDVTGGTCGQNSNNVLQGASCTKVTSGQVTFNDSTNNLVDAIPDGVGTAGGAVLSGFSQAAIAVQYNELLSGTVNTTNASNSVVSFVSGNTFQCVIPGDAITINGTPFTILTVTSTTSLTVSGNAGALTGVPYTSFSPCTGAVKLSNPTRGATYSYNALTFARNQGYFSGLATSFSNFAIGGQNTLPGQNGFAGMNFANGFGISDIGGLPITSTITSWAYTAPSTVVFQSANTLNVGVCIRLKGLVAGAIFNSPYGQCYRLTAANSTSFTINFAAYIPALPSSFPTSGTESSAQAIYDHSSIQWFIEGGPLFTGASVCNGLAFPSGTVGQTLNTAWKTCSSATTPGQSSTLFTNLDQVVFALAPNSGLDTGTANNYNVTLAQSPGSLSDGMEVSFLPLNNSTVAAPSLILNGLGPKAITKNGENALVAGDINANEWAVLIYHASTNHWQLLNPATVGTVTNVTVGNLAPLFTSNVATGNSTPAITYTLSNFAQNGFLAGPSTGGAGVPTVRSIVLADIPDLADVKQFVPANCNNATAASGFSLGTSGTPTAVCRSGTNVITGYLQFAASQSAQFQTELPADWDSASNPFIRVNYTQANGTASQTIAFQVQVGCSSTTDDPSFATAQAFTTTTTGATANTPYTQTLQFNATSMTNCAAGKMMNVLISTTAGSTGTANLQMVTMTTPRKTVIQAN